MLHWWQWGDDEAFDTVRGRSKCNGYREMDAFGRFFDNFIYFFLVWFVKFRIIFFCWQITVLHVIISLVIMYLKLWVIVVSCSCKIEKLIWILYIHTLYRKLFTHCFRHYMLCGLINESIEIAPVLSSPRRPTKQNIRVKRL